LARRAGEYEVVDEVAGQILGALGSADESRVPGVS
jgi:hypothetical protein